MTAVEKITVLLPNGKQFEAVSRTIEAAATETGTSLARPDVEFSSGQRLGAACGEIEKCDLVLAEISGRNPNVLYLAGYAHGIGKPVLFLALHGEDFPFDQGRHPALIYSGNLEYLKKELLAKIRGEQAGPAETSAAGGPREKFNAIFGDIMKAHRQEHRGEIEMENDKTFVLLDQDLELPLVQDLARKARELGLRIKLM